MPTETKTSSKLSIDELLDHQAKVALTATVEPIVDEPTLVKVTPFTPHTGCLCNLPMRVPKDAISHVISTGQTHFCCGKRLLIVEVHFRDGASLPLKIVFEQLQHAALSFLSNCPFVGAIRCQNGHLQVCKESGPTGNLEWKDTDTPC